MSTTQKYGWALVVIAVLGVATVAAAQTIYPPTTPAPTEPTAPTDPTGTTSTTTPDATTPVAGQYPAPMVVDIDGGGNALIRGVVETAGADSITVSTWGGTWTITTATTGSVVPAGSAGANDLSAIQTGHFVGAEGTVAVDGSNTLTATFVRDWTTNPYTGPALNTGAAGTVPGGVGGEGDASGGPTFTPSNPLMDGTSDADLNTDEDDDTTEDADEDNDVDTIDDEEGTTTDDDTDNI